MLRYLKYALILFVAFFSIMFLFFLCSGSNFRVPGMSHGPISLEKVINYHLKDILILSVTFAITLPFFIFSIEDYEKKKKLCDDYSKPKTGKDPILDKIIEDALEDGRKKRMEKHKEYGENEPGWLKSLWNKIANNNIDLDA